MNNDKGRDGGLGAGARQDEEARKHNTGRDKMDLLFHYPIHVRVCCVSRYVRSNIRVQTTRIFGESISLGYSTYHTETCAYVRLLESQTTIAPPHFGKYIGRSKKGDGKSSLCDMSWVWKSEIRSQKYGGHYNHSPLFERMKCVDSLDIVIGTGFD